MTFHLSRARCADHLSQARCAENSPMLTHRDGRRQGPGSPACVRVSLRWSSELRKRNPENIKSPELAASWPRARHQGATGTGVTEASNLIFFILMIQAINPALAQGGFPADSNNFKGAFPQAGNRSQRHQQTPARPAALHLAVPGIVLETSRDNGPGKIGPELGIPPQQAGRVPDPLISRCGHQRAPPKILPGTASCIHLANQAKGG